MSDDQAFLILVEEGAGVARIVPAGRRRVRLRRGAFLFPTTA
jgi:hypothetical protein